MSPRGRGRPALIDRDKIVRAALDIAREDGIERVTMSGVAQRLEVETPSLYYHVRNIDDLLGLVAAELLKQLRVPDVRLRWDRWLREFAFELRSILKEHALLTRVPYLSVHSPFRAAVLDRALRVMTRAGFAPEYALLLFTQFSNTVVSLTFADHAREREAQGGRGSVRLLREAAKHADADEIPMLANLLDRMEALPDDATDYADRLFEWQLDMEIAAMTAVLEGRVPLRFFGRIARD